MRSDTVLIYLITVFLISSIIISIAPYYYIKEDSSLTNPHNNNSSLPLVSYSSTYKYNNNNKQNDRNKKKHIAILCIERSGSTWLTAMLNGNNKVHILAEPLLQLAGKHKNSPIKDISALNELNLLISSLTPLELNHEYQLIGFNEKFVSPKFLLPTHPSTLKSFSGYLKDHDYKIIVLIRKNHIFQAVSTIRAVQLAERCGDAGWSKVNQIGWEEICGKAYQEINSLNISVITLHETLKEVRSKTRQILESVSQITLPHLLVYYEDLMESTKETIKTISNWIDYPLQTTSTIYVKQGSTELSKTIPNFKEIQSYLERVDPCLVDHLLTFNPKEFCLDDPEQK